MDGHWQGYVKVEQPSGLLAWNCTKRLANIRLTRAIRCISLDFDAALGH
jgi:hypothetical protein